MGRILRAKGLKNRENARLTARAARAGIAFMDILQSYTGRIGETHTSSWFTVDQDQVNAFADVTKDHQFIHVDPERAATETPFGGPIAHGFLTLSMLSHFAGEE